MDYDPKGNREPMLTEINVPLSLDHFNSWHKEEFIPHIKQEEVNEKRVVSIEFALSNWLRLISVISGLVVIMGSSTIGLFFWVLLEKNTHIENLQKDTSRLMIIQQGVLKTLEEHSENSKQSINADRLILQQLHEHIKSDNEAFLSIARGKFAK